jgi:subtilisin family serine protease
MSASFKNQNAYWLPNYITSKEPHPSGNNATNKVAVFSTSAGTSVKRYVTAPGDSIRSTSFGINSNNEAVPNYTNDAGTSFSAPIVAAAAAILRQASPNAAPEAIVNALLQTADSSGLYL